MWQLGLRSGQLSRGRRLPLSQRGHALAQLVQGEQFSLIRLKESCHGLAEPGRLPCNPFVLGRDRIFSRNRTQTPLVKDKH